MGSARTTLEVADVFNKFSHLLGSQPKEVWKVVDAIRNCRTRVLGGHMMRCNSCDFEKNAYNSCRNRHCPKCQFITRERWTQAREQDLLPCVYFHVVFTVPGELRPVFLQNKRICYDLLFKAASETIREVAANEKNLGAQTGSIGVLHTWAQNLVDHPHVHFIVPGGGLTKDGKWRGCRGKFFAPIRVLSQVFQAKLLSGLRAAYNSQELRFFGEQIPFSSPQIFDALLLDVAQKDFVVYAKQPFDGPMQVIKYLGGYTHRIAISNYRLVSMDGEKISFRVRDTSNPGGQKIMTLHVVEFMRRFLLHVLPKGFVRIRHFGFLGSRAKKKSLEFIRSLFGAIRLISKEQVQEHWKQLLARKFGINADECPKCRKGQLEVISSYWPLLNSS
jgi:hypothetical protein